MHTNTLFYGDNLHVLREHVKDESVDLIYLDPPFNSKRDYNLLFKTPKGMESDAQPAQYGWNQAYSELLRTAALEINPGQTGISAARKRLAAFSESPFVRDEVISRDWVDDVKQGAFGDV